MLIELNRIAHQLKGVIGILGETEIENMAKSVNLAFIQIATPA